MSIVTKIGRVYFKRLVVRTIAVVAVDIVRRCQSKHPRSAAASPCHAATNANRGRRSGHRSVVGIWSRILEHALTVEWRRCWIAKRRPHLVPREVPGKTEPPHNLAEHAAVEWVQDRSPHILE